ncbi:MAG TPA: hypothetical protein VFX49_23285 [Chloroflexota bacterium]|nr:hypothetical protein [Chloroflexota bacterium]
MRWPRRAPQVVVGLTLAAVLGLAAPAAPAAAQDVSGEEPPPPAATPAGPSGVAALLDDRAILDRLELRVAGLPPAPVGLVYRVWLRSDDETLAEAAGELSVDANGEAAMAWSEPGGEALFVAYSQVLVTLERAAPAAQPGTLVLGGRVDPGALTQFRRLLVRWPDSRYGTASLQGLRQLVANTTLQAAVLREAAANADLAAMRRKAEHLVNLVEGSHGAYAGDLDGDGRAEDPGDGVGLLPYLWGALMQTQFGWAVAVDERVADESLAVQPALRYALAWAGFVRDTGSELAQTTEVSRARELAGHLSTAVGRITAAVDPRDDEALRQEIAAQELAPAYESALGLLHVALLPPASQATAAGGAPEGKGG